MSTPIVEMPTAGAEPVVKMGGDSPTSFDELEAVTTKGKEDGTTDSKPTKETKSQKDDEEAKSKKTTKEKDSEKEDKESGKKEIKAKDSEKVDTPQKEVKTYKGKRLDSELDLYGDTEVTIKVDGKPVTIKVDDLVSNYSGKTAWDRRFQELSSERKAFEAKSTAINKGLNQLKQKLVDEGDIDGAMDLLAKIYEQDPNALREKTLGKWMENRAKLESMSAEQREAHLARQEAENYKKQLEEFRSTQQRAELETKIKKELDDVKANLGIDDNGLKTTYEQMLEVGYKAEDITTQGIKEFYEARHHAGVVETVLKESGVEGDEFEKLYQEIVRDTFQRDKNGKLIFGEPEIRQIVETVLNKPLAKIAKKIEKHSQITKVGKEPKNPQNDPLFFDELD